MSTIYIVTKRFFEKIQSGGWAHVFAEGRVWQKWRFDEGEAVLGPFKIGNTIMLRVGDLCDYFTANII